MEKEFTCICGFICYGSQKYNSHRGHCKQYLQSVGKYEKVIEAGKKASEVGRKAYLQQLADRRQTTNELWLAEQHTCERCGKILTEKFGSGRFCSRACASARDHSEASKAKIKYSNTGKSRKAQDNSKYLLKVNAYLQNPVYCAVCGNSLSYDKRFRKTCSDECFHLALSAAGKTSAAISVKRSKNEIAFCKLCENHFGIENVLHNEPMFNGWDADIILPKYKLAILWNGPWHYKTILNGHSLKQVQTRDAIKVAEIEKYGFIPYIIKDLAKECETKAFTEFNKLLLFIQTL